ncbi:MAG TPA: GDYXXLXY domain-containing protein [Candidatus Methylomirabilis sp.]|nr:GDYXXLXY domain-containing protein [Candidatus Methylomirabilis sp.]
MKKETKIFLGITVFWLLLAVGIMLPNQIVVWSGQEVLIRVFPVDPSDVFRGNYMSLRYDITRVKNNRKIGDVLDPLFTINEKVYVSLEKGTNGEVSAKATLNKKPTGLFIKGKLIVRSAGYDEIEYGIEKYFFAQSDRSKIFTLLKNGACGRVYISYSGKAVLKDLVPCPVK